MYIPLVVYLIRIFLFQSESENESQNRQNSGEKRKFVGSKKEHLSKVNILFSFINFRNILSNDTQSNY